MVHHFPSLSRSFLWQEAMKCRRKTTSESFIRLTRLAAVVAIALRGLCPETYRVYHSINCSQFFSFSLRRHLFVLRTVVSRHLLTTWSNFTINIKIYAMGWKNLESAKACRSVLMLPSHSNIPSRTLVSLWPSSNCNTGNKSRRSFLPSRSSQMMHSYLFYQLLLSFLDATCWTNGWVLSLPIITPSPPKHRYISFRFFILNQAYCPITLPQLLISEFLSLNDNDAELEQNKELILAL